MADGSVAAEISAVGLSVLGRSQYGMYQISDFTHNAMNVHRNISNIPEIDTLMQILGLKYNADYSTEADRKSLRYGKLMMMTDQNEEGSLFKGLLINFIYTNWPHLLREPYLEEFITPVVKAKKGETKFSFFSLEKFEEWKVNEPESHTYKVRHYRGLGTNNRIEAKEYFTNIDHHRVIFKYSGPEDDVNLRKAFAPDALEQRREWLTNHMNECKRRDALGLQDICLYTGTTKEITFSEFINLEYVYYANFCNVRSIPSIIDGFKPGQRKVLFTCIKRNDRDNVRVIQLACSVAETAAYYQNERSLCQIVYQMAQNYVGSNNINLLIPVGQFGTRLMGGKDCAEHYYTYTKMSTITRLIFHPQDDPLLSYNCDDNQKIEPKWYLPIIPMLLVNGSEYTGTGWSTKIPSHDPHQIIQCLRNMIAGEEPGLLTPYYKNFLGTIQAVGESNFVTIGRLAIIESEKIEITELPIGTWTQSYKETVLEQLLNGETTRPIISGYKEYHSDRTVRFVISFAPGEFDKLKNEIGGFYRVFKLCKIIKTNNMHAFDGSDTLRRYETANEILKEFYDLRLNFYAKRKEYLERKLTAEADKLSNQARFILAKTSNALVIENKTRKSMIDELIELGYVADPVEKWKQENGIETIEDELDELQHLSSAEKNDARKYDYLLRMSMWMLTDEIKNQLINSRDNKISELKAVKERSKYDLWLSDLEELEKKLCELEEEERMDSLKTLDKKHLRPSDDGKDVEFIITDEFIEEYCQNNEQE